MHTKLVLLCCLTEYLHGTSEESVSVLHADERNDIGIRAVPVRYLCCCQSLLMVGIAISEWFWKS